MLNTIFSYVTFAEKMSVAPENDIVAEGYLTIMPVQSPLKIPQNSTASYRSSEIATGTRAKSASWF